jgi:HEAT repeat protein
MKKRTSSTRISRDRLIASLIEGLASKRPAVREKSRKQLVDIGHAAVIPLLRKLNDSTEHVRWESAKALDTIGDLAAADALVEALVDASDDVRWVADQALIALGWDTFRLSYATGMLGRAG